MDQLYGAYDLSTNEWNDGVTLCIIFESPAYANDDTKQWIVFDGPIDALWVESMNTVLDDNKKLCLVSGEIITMTKHMVIMFEVENLAVASPATVSRCGMIYLDTRCVPISANIFSWIENLPKWTVYLHPLLRAMASHYIQPLIEFVYKNSKEYIPTVERNLVQSLFNMINGYMKQLAPLNAASVVLPEKELLNLKCVNALFIQSLVWSIGATGCRSSRVKFDAKVRELIESYKDVNGSGPSNSNILFPSEGLVYDYFLKFPVESDIDQFQPYWELWESTVTPLSLKYTVPYADITVPTIDTVRQDSIVRHLITNLNHVAIVGPSGTGKSVCLIRQVIDNIPDLFQGLYITFSAQTSCNMLQDWLLSKLEKRRNSVYGPPMGSNLICFIDDANLPKREIYLAQPPLELVRQWIGQGGCYTHSNAIKFQRIIDLKFAITMGPPGGGRNPVSNRFLRLFNMIAFPDIEIQTLHYIFSSIIKAAFTIASIGQDIQDCIDLLVSSSLNIFSKCSDIFTPKPAHVHYMFNLRDLSRVYSLIYTANSKVITSVEVFVRMWLHELERAFYDRLISDSDREKYREIVDFELRNTLKIKGGYAQIQVASRLIYGNYMETRAELRKYEEIIDINDLHATMNQYLCTLNSEEGY